MTAIGISDARPKDPHRLRELAAWYREFADRAGNPVIWEARLQTAAELEREADRLLSVEPAGHGKASGRRRLGSPRKT
jgi:hypothetical protein